MNLQDFVLLSYNISFNILKLFEIQEIGLKSQYGVSCPFCLCYSLLWHGKVSGSKYVFHSGSYLWSLSHSVWAQTSYMANDLWHCLILLIVQQDMSHSISDRKTAKLQHRATKHNSDKRGRLFCLWQDNASLQHRAAKQGSDKRERLFCHWQDNVSLQHRAATHGPD